MSTASASCDSTESYASYADELTKRSPRRRTDVGHRDIFIVPLKRGPDCKKGMYFSYDFGNKCWKYKVNKVIMLVGATGTGKSTLINAMINYIVGVKWEDNFRFKLVDEHGSWAQSQAHSQTQIISSYTVHSNEQHKIPFTLTIIDTPGLGDTRGIERDKAIVENIREFFSHPEDHGVYHINTVGLVVQATEARLTPTQRYIFESTLSLFDKDIKPNIVLLVTFWGGGKLVVLDAIKEAEIPYNECVFKFNNAALFAKNKEGKAESDSDEEEEESPFKLYWQKGMKEMKRFFQTVSESEGKSLTLSKEVLENRKQLEQKVERVQSEADICTDTLRELEKEQEVLERCQREIEDNESFQCETEVIEVEKIDSAVGSLNCDRCQFTCHYPCRRPDDQKRKCHMMDRSGHCMVCPNKCIWSAHVIRNYRHVYTKKEKVTRFAHIERRYRDAIDERFTVQTRIGKLEFDIENSKKVDAVLVEEIHGHVQRLEEIALKPHPIGLTEYIDLLIESEQQEANTGWQERVKTLQSYRSQQNKLDSLKSGFKRRMDNLPFGNMFTFNNSKLFASRDGGMSVDALQYHNPCSRSGDANIKGCHAMSDHVHQNFRYHWRIKQRQTYGDVENRYRDAQGQKQPREEVIKKVEADLAQSEAAVSELIDETHRCTQRLVQIALRPNPVRIEEYLDMLIETEKATKNKVWEKRVGSLGATKERENSGKGDAAASENAWNYVWKKMLEFPKT